MALDAVVLDTLGQQVTRERTNEAAYLAIGYRFDVLNLEGFAKWAYAAAHEEAEHSRKFSDYLIDRGGMPVVAPLNGINPPQASDMFSAPAALVAFALQVELSNTEAIKTLHELADEADDPQTCVFLIWALEEQTKAERELTTLLAKCEFAKGCASAILALDKELGA